MSNRPARSRTAPAPVIPSPRFRLTPFEALKPGATPNYLIKGLIPRVGLTVIWGPPKCGKSFWTFDAVMHVALGWEYRGRRVEHGPIVYCAFEGAEGFKARAEAFRQRFLGDNETDVPFYLSASPMDLVKDHASLNASIAAYVPDGSPVAVVLDTLNRSLAGSESSDEDMSAYIRAADSVRDAYDCAVIIVHHCGVDATRPRGHTSLLGAADAQIAVKRDTSDNIIAAFECMKDGPDGENVVSRLEVVEVGTDDDGDAITSCVVLPADEVSRRPDAKLSAANRIALDLLEKAIANTDVSAPASNHIPPGSRTTTLELWRRYCDAGTVSKSEKPDSRRKSFVRAVEYLQTRSIIGVWGDYVWIAGQTGQ